MTMENQEWNRKIWQNVRNKIVVSNLEREESMKLNKRKQLLSAVAVMVIMFAGSFFTVNAATDGKVVEELKKVITINYDQSKYKVVTENEIENIDGDEYVKYEVVSNDGTEEYTTLINKSEMDKQNLQTEINVTSTKTDNEAESGVDVIISDKK